MGITLKAKNFRVLRNASWSPSGVCALVGPNGSGKTTFLSLFEFLHNSYQRTIHNALSHLGGPTNLRHFGTMENEPIVVELSVDDLSWQLELMARDGVLEARPKEAVTLRGQLFISREPGGREIITNRGNYPVTDGHDQRLALRFVYDLGTYPELEPLVSQLKWFRVYRHYNLLNLRHHGSPSSGDFFLNPTGENAFTILRNWHSRREHRPRYEFVIATLRAAFPDQFADLDFEQAGQAVSIRLFEPRWNEPHSAFFASNGLLTALLHVLAVAGTEPGSLVALDEVENTLHPWAIHTLIEAFREWADEHELTICLATHSPVVLNQFKEEMERVFVLDPRESRQPAAITDLYAPDWLRQFYLGDLYAFGEFGNQRTVTPVGPLS